MRYQLFMGRLAMVLMAAGVVDTCAARGAMAQSTEVDKCVQSFHETQRLHRDGKLRRARQSAAECGGGACPSALASQCVRWLREIDDSMPTVVLGARDKSGAEVLEVRVLFDGEMLAQRLDGRALPVDPGPHVLRFEGPLQATAELPIIIRQGEKDRSVIVDLAPPSPAASGSGPRATHSPPAAPSGSQSASGLLPDRTSAPRASRSASSAALVLGAVGVLGAASFVYFGWKARKEYDEMRGSCSPNCDPADVDSARHKAWIADGSLAVGVACLGIAGWLLVRAPSRRDASPAAARMTVRASPQWVGVAGEF